MSFAALSTFGEEPKALIMREQKQNEANLHPSGSLGSEKTFLI